MTTKGSVGILNVGLGDTKLTFDKSNPQECIRAARIVTDMLRRGYALLVQVDEKDGRPIYQRAKAFDETTCEYIIADFDPVAAEKADQAEAEKAREEAIETAAPADGGESQDEPAASKRRGRPRNADRKIPASATRAVAVARSAGG